MGSMIRSSKRTQVTRTLKSKCQKSVICSSFSGLESNKCKFNEYISERVYTIPNMITVSRIIASPFLAFAIYEDKREIVLAGTLIAAFSDWLDGYIAKTYDQKSVLGAFLDPVADKVIIGALTLGLTLKNLIPFPLACIIIGRDVALIAASFYIRTK